MNKILKVLFGIMITGIIFIILSSLICITFIPKAYLNQTITQNKGIVLGNDKICFVNTSPNSAELRLFNDSKFNCIFSNSRTADNRDKLIRGSFLKIHTKKGEHKIMMNRRLSSGEIELTIEYPSNLIIKLCKGSLF